MATTTCLWTPRQSEAMQNRMKTDQRETLKTTPQLQKHVILWFFVLLYAPRQRKLNVIIRHTSRTGAGVTYA